MADQTRGLDRTRPLERRGGAGGEGGQDAYAATVAQWGSVPPASGGTQDGKPVSGETPPVDALPAGTVIGERYVIDKHVSSGGFGSVYKAADRSIEGHFVALKILHAAADSEDARAAALRELRLLAAVSHPSVVQFKDYGWHEGRLWFAMPWYEGQTLAEWLSDPDTGEKTPITRAKARPIFERLALGLAAMHEVGILHHDIKPENIFIAEIAGFEGGLPVLLDLGIAAKTDEAPIGFTPQYVAPETAAAALRDPIAPVGQKADVYSLALVLRNALEPESAVDIDENAEDPREFLRERMNEPVPPPRSKDLRYLQPDFERWLSLDPDARPDANMLARELRRLTWPEERRRARARLLKRTAPFAAAAVALVAFLGVELAEQREQLTEQQRQSQRLRQKTQEQIEQLEAQATQMGAQSGRLREAISLARELDERLNEADEAIDGLRRRLRVQQRRARALQAERDELQADVADLEETRDTLTAERAALRTRRDQLQGDLERIREQRELLQQEHDRLLAKHETTLAELASLEQQRDRLQVERDTMTRERDAIAAELRTLRRDHQALLEERDQLRAERDLLQRRAQARRRAQQSARQGETSPSAPREREEAENTPAPAEPSADDGR